MPIRTARSIDGLYDAVAGYDLVIADDGPLSLALDNRIREPRLGRLAATPRSHATGEMIPQDTRELFLELIAATDHGWKTLTRALDLCIACWTATGSLERILEYPEFDTPAIRAVVSHLSTAESSYAAVAENALDADLDVAVIDEWRLTDLDRGYLPPDYETVSSLREVPDPLPPLHVYPSATAIVETVLDAVSAESAENVGVVLPSGGVYSSLLEAGLEARGIPHRGGEGFTDDPTVRAFCRLLDAAFAGSAQWVGDVRPLLAAVGTEPSQALDERRVDSVPPGELGGYREFRDAVATGTFRDALASFESLVGTRVAHLRDELETVGLLDATVTEAAFAGFRYYVETFDVPTDGDGNEGVLLTEATATAYVDRPVVFYLGLGSEWARSPPDYPWVDSEAFLERDLRRFERLLGNGQQRYFLVQEAHAGEDVRPCVSLQQLLDDTIDSFTDVEHVRHESDVREADRSPFVAPTPPATEGEPVDTLSQSRLNSLANSPRDAYFDRLVDSPTSLAMARGRVLHEAAEIHVADPTIIPSRRAAVLDAMCEQLDRYLEDARRPVIRTRLDVGLDAVLETLDSDPPTADEYRTYEHRDRENALAAQLDVDAASPLTERWFASPAVGVHGYVDLLQDATTVADYKTGRMKDAADHLESAAIDPVAETPDFQALAYLAKHREERPDEAIRMRFVYLLDDDHVDDAVAGDPPAPTDRVSTVTYVPATFSEFVARRETFETVTEYADSNDRCKALDKLGYEAYREFFETHALPREGVDPDRRERVTEAFVEYTVDRVGDYKYVANGCRSVIDDLTDAPAGYVLRADLDAFEQFVDERIDDYNEWARGRFPVAYRDDGPTWNRVDHDDLILTDR